MRFTGFERKTCKECSSIRSSISGNLAVIERTKRSVDTLVSKIDDLFLDRASVLLNVNIAARSESVTPADRSAPSSATYNAPASEVQPPDVAHVATSGGRAWSESEPQPPHYRMIQAIPTVFDLSREWSVGIAGCPAFKTLEHAWGSKWRQSPTELESLFQQK
jgi:hypothetical protein